MIAEALAWVKSDPLFVRPDPDGRLVTTGEVASKWAAASPFFGGMLCYFIKIPGTKEGQPFFGRACDVLQLVFDWSGQALPRWDAAPYTKQSIGEQKSKRAWMRLTGPWSPHMEAWSGTPPMKPQFITPAPR
jgi:hypothetical protein